MINSGYQIKMQEINHGRLSICLSLDTAPVQVPGLGPWRRWRPLLSGHAETLSRRAGAMRNYLGPHPIERSGSFWCVAPMEEWSAWQAAAAARRSRLTARGHVRAGLNGPSIWKATGHTWAHFSRFNFDWSHTQVFFFSNFLGVVMNSKWNCEWGMKWTNDETEWEKGFGFFVSRKQHYFSVCKYFFYI